MKANKRYSRLFRRGLAGVLSLCLLFPTAAFGAEDAKNGLPPITYDEAMYVTMDYYGNRRQISMVKGVDLNGNRFFTDYGSYRSVQNMSTYDQPELTADGVMFHLKDSEKNRFYFEAVPNEPDAVALPWNFKVSYRLNGVPAKAEELAGRSGLVEMIAECEANPEVNDYLKNNMLLELVTLVDMDRHLSVEAEGAQIQSVGKYKAVIFAALPGESVTFRIRIGTNAFSSVGLIMMMEPGTLAQMEQIRELREMTDLLGNTPTVLLSGMRGMLNSLSGVTDHLRTAGEGINHLKSAYADVKDYSADLLDAAKENMAAFAALSEDLSALLPYVEQAAGAVDRIKALLERLKEMLEHPEQMTIHALRETLDAAQNDFEILSRSSTDAAQLVELMRASAEKLQTILDKMPMLAEQGAGLLSPLEALVADLNGMTELLRQLAEQKEQVEQMLQKMEELSQNLNGTQVLETAVKLLATIQQALEQARQTGAHLSQVTAAVSTLFGALTDAVSDTSSDFNTGIQQVLEGLSGAAADAQGVSTSAGQLQQVGDTLQSAMNKVLSRYTEQNHLLALDASAQRQSFTSEKNAAPSSLQVILRTQTIGVTLMQETDREEEQAARTPWERILQVFQKIWRAILTLFE